MNIESYFEFLQNNEELQKKVDADKYRLHFHLMPPTGWLNDPNGLCVIKGVNHIYYQYTPFSATWGMKLWGHYSTTNWIEYSEHPAFLFPDISEDKDGVYSGSAFVENDKIHYFYTGNVKHTDKKYDYILNGREQNVIEIVSEDGFTYDKKKVLLKNKDYPKNMSTHVRDPKIFKVNNEYYMILGARTKNNKGCAVLYKSADLKKWSFHMTIESELDYGYMWECCDLVEVDKKWFLICCPQGMEQEGLDFANIYQIGYFPIDIDFKNKTYDLGKFYELDRGFDIYAPQTFIDNSNRLVLLAWMGIPDAEYHNNRTVANGWQHSLSMPRELSTKGNRLFQKPLNEYKNLRIEEKVFSEEKINFQASVFELLINIEDENMFELRIEDLFLSYKNNIFSLEMGESGDGRDYRGVHLENLKNLQIFVDTSSIEIFLNNGEEVFTSRFYPNNPILDVNIQNVGTCTLYKLDKFKLNKDF